MKRFFVCLALVLLSVSFVRVAAAADIFCWFPPDWKVKSDSAKRITDVLSEKSGSSIKPRIANSYPQILEAFSSGDPCLVYVGSFVQSIIRERGNGVPLVQAVNGKEFYASWMIYPKGKSPEEILQKNPSEIAFATGASSGESGAKAATNGKAQVKAPSHEAAVNAVKAGMAKAAFVKNWWWESNKEKFAGFEAYQVPGVSDQKNPDNVLTASKAVPETVRAKIAEAALASAEVFGTQKMASFESASLNFSVDLMRKGGLDPHKYAW